MTGLNEAKISFNDFPVSFDNEFYLALNFTDKIRVVEIRNSASRTVVEKVFGNGQIFDFASYPVTNFNYSLLSQADLVVVNGLNTIDAALAGALRTYIMNLEVCFIAPGNNPDGPSLKAFCNALAECRDKHATAGPGKTRIFQILF